jgi:hypothetical protein
MTFGNVTRLVFGGFALVGIAAVALQPRVALTQEKPSTLGHRLLAHFRDRDDYHLFVGIPAAHPTNWAEVARIDDSSVTLRSSEAFGDGLFRDLSAWWVRGWRISE